MTPSDLLHFHQANISAGWLLAALAAIALGVSTTLKPARAEQPPPSLRVGVIGLDTSHAPAFTRLLNAADAPPELANCRVVAAYPKGSPDIASSVSRVEGYIEEMRKLDVEIVDSIDILLQRVDVVLLETNDGRPHLEQVTPVLQAGKRVFIDKPLAGSLSDSVAIFELARRLQVPVFSASSLRFSSGAQALRRGEFGAVHGCDAYSPCSLEATHPDLFWYGIHGVETLFTVMGVGCESVSRTQTDGAELAVGKWKDGRLGTFRGLRTNPSGYGGTAFTEKGIRPIGDYEGYRPQVVEIVKFFRTGEAPVTAEETLEIYAFMEAADRSKERVGAHVALADVLAEAKSEAERKLAAIQAGAAAPR